MGLTEEQLRSYEEDGYVFVPELLPRAPVEAVMARVPELARLERREVILEKDGATVRSLMNLHRFCPEADRLIRQRRLIEPAEQILGSRVYVFQSILNLKRAFTGDMWQWHQDFPTYLHDDGVPTDRMVNVLVFLEAVTEFNGPLMMVPGAHRAEAYRADLDTTTTSYPLRALDPARVAELIARGGIVAPKGPPGSVIFAHTNFLHGSGPNMSPWGRAMLSLTLNSVENRHRGSRRPDWVVLDDCTPVAALD